MKKIFFLQIMLIMSFVSTYAINEEEMLRGCYFVAEEYGNTEWENAPISVHFKDDGTCVYTDNRGTLECYAYIVSNNGNKLHLLAGRNFDGDLVPTAINLRLNGVGLLGHYSGFWVSLGAYDNPSKFSMMKKQEQTNEIRAIESQRESNGTEYNLQGIRSAKSIGVTILNGKKEIRK